jgi:hypothetical protein
MGRHCSLLGVAGNAGMRLTLGKASALRGAKDSKKRPARQTF